MPHPGGGDTVLILTPIKDAARFCDSYFDGLARLNYPPDRISLGILESDSTDDCAERFAARLAAIAPRYASAAIWRKDFGFHVPQGLPRWHESIQLPRRTALAKSRNHLLFRALRDHDWVLWLDVDIIEYPPDLIERLLATGRDIVHPHCVLEYGGPTFDRNGWRDHGRVLLEDMRGGRDLVRLDAVGGTVLWVRADLHRDGLIFPSFPYGAGNAAVRSPHPLGASVHGEIETEGFGIMALDMGHQCWGMPNLEVVHAPDEPIGTHEHEFQILSYLFSVQTNSTTLRDVLAQVSVRAEQQVPIIQRATLGATWTDDMFRISGGGVPDGHELDLTHALQSLYRRAEDCTVTFMADHARIQAACGWSGARQFLLVGGAGAGKSTLATRLMLDGIEMSGDAWVLSRNGTVVAWPRAFQVTEDSVRLLPQLAQAERFRPIAANPRFGWRASLDPLEFGKPWRIGVTAIDAIFVLEPNFGAQSRLRPCSKVEMVQRIIARTTMPATQRAQFLSDLSNAVDQAATYVLDLGTLDSAAAALTEALAR